MSIGVSNSSCQTHEWWFRVSKRRAVISSEKLLVVVVEKLTKKRSLEEKEDDGFSGSRQEEESSYVEFYGGPTQRKTQKRRSSFKRQLGFLLREAPSSKKSLLLDKRTSISSSNYLNNNSHTATSSFMSVEDFRGSYRQTKQEIIMMIPDASSHLISFWKQRGSPVKRNKTWGRNGRLTSYTWFSWTNWWADFHETSINGSLPLGDGGIDSHFRKLSIEILFVKLSKPFFPQGSFFKRVFLVSFSNYQRNISSRSNEF